MSKQTVVVIGQDADKRLLRKGRAYVRPTQEDLRALIAEEMEEEGIEEANEVEYEQAE